MVKRKEVKINEEQIHNIMTGDIPAAVMDSLYGDNTSGSEKEKDSGSETETVPDKVEAPCSGVPDREEETPSPVIWEKIRRKRNRRTAPRKSLNPVGAGARAKTPLVQVVVQYDIA